MSQDDSVTAPPAKLSDQVQLRKYFGSIHDGITSLKGDSLTHSVRLVTYELVEKGWTVLLSTACLLQESRVGAVLQKRRTSRKPTECPLAKPLPTSNAASSSRLLTAATLTEPTMDHAAREA